METGAHTCILYTHTSIYFNYLKLAKDNQNLDTIKTCNKLLNEQVIRSKITNIDTSMNDNAMHLYLDNADFEQKEYYPGIFNRKRYILLGEFSIYAS